MPLEPISKAHKVRQPQCFDRFRCIGAACEDTCCVGWGVYVDRETWEKYQNLSGLRVADKALTSLVEINPARTSSADYAKFRMDGASCPALQEGWCSIQRTLGEPFLPDLCSTYPRVVTVMGGVVEKSLHLSCPEAARLVLSDPEAMAFHERIEEALPHRAGSVGEIAGDPDGRLHRVRTLVIEAIRERSLPLGQRIVSLGLVIESLADADTIRAVTVLEDYLGNLRQGLYTDALAQQNGDPAFQLETVLELIVTRMGSDYTAPRFRECFSDLMNGLAWTPDSTMEELADRYCISTQRYFLPFLRRYPHVLENYLINYIFRTVFPYRRKLPDRKFAIDSGRESLRNAFLLLAVHYAIVRTLLIGMAALYKDNLSVDRVVKLVQSYSKTFMHSSSFETVAIEYLDKNAGDPSGRIAALVMEIS
jgi:lysine-N-methylase